MSGGFAGVADRAAESDDTFIKSSSNKVPSTWVSLALLRQSPYLTPGHHDFMVAYIIKWGLSKALLGGARANDSEFDFCTQ